MNTLNNIFKSAFAKNVMLIAGGTAFAQIISLTLAPIITRLYSPENFGILTIYVSILGVINLLGALSYDSAIPIAEEDDQAINVLMLSFIILFFLTIILTLGLMLMGNYFFKLINAETVIQVKYLIVVGFLLSGLYTVLTKWAIRKKLYKSLATTLYTQSIAGNGSKVFLGLMQVGSIGLISGNILGQSLGISTLIKPIIKEKKLFKKISLSSLRWSAIRYIRFPKYTAPTLFLISLTTQIPVFFLAAYYSPSVVGFYGLALTITFLPMGLIGKSVQDVFMGEASRLGQSNPEEIKEMSDKLLKKLVLLASVPVIILIVSAPQLFSLIFGVKWYMAGVFSSILSIYAYSHFIFHPVSVVFTIFEEQHFLFYLNLIKILIISILFYICNWLNINSIYTVIAFSVTMAIGEYIKYIMAKYILKKSSLRLKISSN